MAKTDKQILDQLISLEALLEAGLSECRKTRILVQGSVSTEPTNRVKKKPVHDNIEAAAKAAVDRRNRFIKSKLRE